MADVSAVLDDLRAEGDEIDAIVASLPAAAWTSPTPAKGWTIAHQIAHLSSTDEVAILAVTDNPSFATLAHRARRDPDRFIAQGAAVGARSTPEELLERWRLGRNRLIEALAQRPPRARIDWFGPPMSVISMATSRLMETWAHGYDVADALRLVRSPTSRLKHIAHLGVLTRDFAYRLRREQPPAEQFYISLTGPTGEAWTWGPTSSTQQVCGTALDFCLLVTQRRHRDDLALRTRGEDAAHWLTIAQAYAGVAGTGRERIQIVRSQLDAASPTLSAEEDQRARR